MPQQLVRASVTMLVLAAALAKPNLIVMHVETLWM